MGKKGSWYSSVKKAFGAQSSEKNKETKKTEVDKDDAHHKNETSTAIATTDNNDATITPPKVELNEEATTNKTHTAFRSHSLRHSTSDVNHVENSEAATKVGHLTTVSSCPSKLNEEVAVMKIQTIFRQYLSNHDDHSEVDVTVNAESAPGVDHPIDMHANAVSDESNDEIAVGKTQVASQEDMGTKTPKALNGLRRIKSFGEGESKGQTKVPKRIQSLSPTLSRSHNQRPKISEERKLPKHDKFKIVEAWNGSPKSKEQVKAKMNHNQEAAMRREKALAFASNVQQTWRNSKNSKTSSSIGKKPNKGQLGRSYSEQWSVSQPKEEKNTMKRFNSLSIKDEIDWNTTIEDLDNKPSMATQKPRRQSSFTSNRRLSLPPGS